MSIAKNVRYLRKKQGWGQDTLAEKLGYKSYTTIQKWESGVSEPPLKVVHALADLFCVDINDLANSDLESVKNGSETKKQPPRGELSEVKQSLIQFSEGLTDEQAALALRVLKSIVETGE